LFVAFDYKAGRRKRHRGRVFADAVKTATTTHGSLLLVIRSEQTKALSHTRRRTKWDVASAVAEMFPHIASKLPPHRKPWESENEWLGLFMALAASVAAWEAFRGRR